MGSKSLQKFSDKLLSNLLEELIFYIPNNDQLNSLLDEHNLYELKQYFEKVIYMDRFKGPLLYTQKRQGPDLHNKSKLLEKNILKLVAKKEQLSETGFNYFFNQYNEYAQGMNTICSWFNDAGRLKEIEQISEGTIKSFELQSEIFQKHIRTLNSTFEKEEKENENILKKLELQLPNLFNQLKEIEKAQLSQQTIVEHIVNSTQQAQLNPTTQNPSKKKKKILISDTEAEEFLLENIFGIKLHH